MGSLRAVALSVLALALLTGAAAALAAHAPRCDALTPSHPQPKPSSYAPHAKPPGNVYGTPVGDTILIKRVKKKKPSPALSASDSPA
jgi:hypothetical protein